MSVREETSMEDPVLLRIEGAVATITLNRPKVLNALDATMVDGLAAAVERVGSASEVRVVVLAGAGAGFMAGRPHRGFNERIHPPPPPKRGCFLPLPPSAPPPPPPPLPPSPP